MIPLIVFVFVDFLWNCIGLPEEFLLRVVVS